MAFFKKWPKMIFLMLTVIAAIGQSSMVETFAHMRTPILMSFVRGVDGLALGAILGIIAMIFIQFFARLYHKGDKTT